MPVSDLSVKKIWILISKSKQTLVQTSAIIGLEFSIFICLYEIDVDDLKIINRNLKTFMVCGTRHP